MAFDARNDSYVSHRSVGGRIKKFRRLRGWSQKQLGIACGFTESTASVRIAQYEKNRKTPSEKILKDISAALGISEGALFTSDISQHELMYHILFDIEDLYDLHPVKKDEAYYLEFGNPESDGDFQLSPEDIRDFLEEWYNARKEMFPDESDSAETKEAKLSSYYLWKGKYPADKENKNKDNRADEHEDSAINTAEQSETALKDISKPESDGAYTEKKNRPEAEGFNHEIEKSMLKYGRTYTPVQTESDFIYIIKSAIENGLLLELLQSAEITGGDPDYIQLMTVRTENILKSEETRRAYVHILCAAETIRKSGINMVRDVLIKNGRQYMTFSYPTSCQRYFDNLIKCRGEIMYIIDRQRFWTKNELEGLEKELKDKITGENDIRF